MRWPPITVGKEVNGPDRISPTGHLYNYQIIDSGESDRVEFRLDTSDEDDIGMTICGMLNGSGGMVVVGVGKTGKVRGVKNAPEQRKKLESFLAQHISPVCHWIVSVEEPVGRSVIAIEVPFGVEKPYVFKDLIYVRRGGRTLIPRREEIVALIERRQIEGSRWERIPALNVDVDDLDNGEIFACAREAFEVRYQGFAEKGDASAILEELRLAYSGSIRNSAVVLFWNRATHAFPQVRIRVAHFADEDQTLLIDNRVFDGHAFSLVGQVEGFLSSHLPIQSELPEKGFKRIDAPSIPWSVLREATMNAIVHRDYSAFDGSITISIYPDRDSCGSSI